MICFKNIDQIYVYLWTLLFSVGFILLLINLILKDDKYSIIFIGIGISIIIYSALLCFCNPMRRIFCKETIFENYIINRTEPINLHIIEKEDEENVISIKSSECINNMHNFTSQYNIPIAKKIIIAENIKII